MTKRRKGRRPDETRQEVRQVAQEMMNAERGDYEESYTAAAAAPDSRPSPSKRLWVVVDTNAILSCVDILYDAGDEDWREPLNFKPDLRHTHIIIPNVVYEELNHIKEEYSNRGMIARIAFDRLSKFFPNSGRSFEEIVTLAKPIKTGWEDQEISLLLLPKDFYKCLPWVPDRNDNDGWIAVTALAATMIREGVNIRQRIDTEDIMKEKFDNNVILLTNDKPLLGKADLYGVRTERYSFTRRPVYTGCRELTVPAEMFAKFFHEERLTREEFEAYMPDELPLVANEYIIMTPEGDNYPRSYFTIGVPYPNIGRYHKEKGMIYPPRFMKHEGMVPPNAGIACYYDALNDDKIKVVVVHGGAGNGKTYTATVHAIKAVKAGLYRRIIVVPSQSSKNNLGALPGDQDQKMEPMVAFIKEAIESYLTSTPEFQRKREELRKFGDLDNDAANDEVAHEKPLKCTKPDRRSKNRTRGTYTGSFEDIDFGDNDYMVEDPEGFYSEKAEKANRKSKPYYPGKSEKKIQDNNGDSYNQMLKKQVDYIYDRYFCSYPYEQVMGRNFADSIIILDEFQRIQIDDADTLVSRPAEGSKLVVIGDTKQIHNASPEKQLKNGLNYTRMLFFDWPGAANIFLTENMRSSISGVASGNRDEVRDNLLNENPRKVHRRMGLIC